MTPMLVSLQIRTCCKTLLAVYLVLLGCHLLTIFLNFGLGYDHVKGLNALFDFDDERNIPTLFNVALIVQAACLCYLVGRRKDPGNARWLLLSAIFLFLAVDEFAGLHERLIRPFGLSTTGFSAMLCSNICVMRFRLLG